MTTIDLGAEAVRPTTLLRGSGVAPSHHGELLQGVFEDGGGLHRGLVTLPCPVFGSRATIRLAPRPGILAVRPAWKEKARRAAECTLGALGVTAVDGVLEIESDVDVGRGLGSSTSDVVATVHAVLDAVGAQMPPERVAAVAVESETAVDPLMYDRMVLFAHREADVLEDFHAPVPAMRVLGFAATGGTIDTLGLPPARYGTWEVECFRALRGLLRRSVRHRDPVGIGRVATASAMINQRFLPVPGFDRLRAIARRCGALGVQVAHSGTVVGLLWDEQVPRVTASVAEARRLVEELGIETTWTFTTEGGWA